MLNGRTATAADVVHLNRLAICEISELWRPARTFIDASITASRARRRCYPNVRIGKWRNRPLQIADDVCFQAGATVTPMTEMRRLASAAPLGNGAASG